MNHKNILIHGYNKKSKDMRVLKGHLEKLGYENILVDLPLTFKEIQYSSIVFENRFKGLIKDLPEGEKINLIGHSTGGLIIRYFLSTSGYERYVNKCILISTPNNGSELADLAGKISKPFINVFKTLKSLQTKEVQQLQLKDSIKGIAIGAIGGDNNNLFLGRFLPSPNDGRVTVDSVRYEGLKDFHILPYGHKDIHYKFHTAELIDSFLKFDRFEGVQQ